MRFLRKEDILLFNQFMISTTGGEFLGKDNLHNSSSLDWVLYAMQNPIFGIDHYPKLVDKAAILGWKIITAHVFFDGNKRTGMFSLLKFLEINHFLVDVSNQEIIDIAQLIATHSSNQFTEQDLAIWINGNMKIILRGNI